MSGVSLAPISLMADVTIYTRQMCGYCSAAKRLLDRKGVAYTEHDATFSPELADLTIYVIDVSAGDKIPRKGGPGITRSDILVINKVDVAPIVHADLDVMAKDAGIQRKDKPFVFANMREGLGLERIIELILELAGLPKRKSRFVETLPALQDWS